jgi:hypothetical protein
MPHFNTEAFEEHLSTIPEDLLVEMASDGVICEQEIAHLVELLGLEPELSDAIKRNAEQVGKHIMEYVERTMPEALHEGMCRLNAQQAAEVMRHLLSEGLISGFYQHAEEASRQEGLPGRTIHDNGRAV